IGAGEFADSGLYLFRQERVVVGILRLEAVRIDLAVDGMRWSCDAGLVERNWNGLMHAMISNVADRQDQVVPGLPLQIQTPVFRIGQLVGGIVSAEQEVEWRAEVRGSAGWRYRFGATADLRHVVH